MGSFAEKPPEVRDAIRKGDTTALQNMGAKGAEHHEAIANEHRYQLEQEAAEVMREFNDAHLLDDEGRHVVSGERIDPTTVQKMLERIHKLEANHKKRKV